jgi:alpha-glucosidase (family GH31 glycosyl hydrolase)
MMILFASTAKSYPQMVVIIDPHLKRSQDYPVFKAASDRGILVKPKGGEGEYEGWCWSGQSSWIDMFNPGAWDWWKSLFSTKALPGGAWSWTQSTEDVHIWNDMNEVGFSASYTEKALNDLFVFPYFSHLYSMVLKSPCREIMSTMADGNTVISTISMECYS